MKHNRNGLGFYDGVEEDADGYLMTVAEHDRLMAEKDAEIASAQRRAYERAAECCEAEADKCDDAVKWNGPGRYARDCKAAAYAMRDRAAAIRAMKG